MTKDKLLFTDVCFAICDILKGFQKLCIVRVWDKIADMPINKGEKIGK